MGKCSYAWNEFEPEKGKYVKKCCQQETWEDSDEYCIFHDSSPDKDVDLFKENLEEQMESETDKHNFIGYYFPKNWDFSGHKFEIDVDFRGTTFQGANFSEATFQGRADFSGAIFQNANFWRSTFQNTIFKGATFQDTNFGAAAFRGTGNFWGTEFQGYTNFWGTEFQDVVFTEATFQNPYFEEAKFWGNVHFIEATFKKATFLGATFQSKANFWEATFEEATFLGATFQGYGVFGMATFQDANFRRTKFQGKANFWGTEFQRAKFEEATFQDAIFKKATFQGNADFEGATFQDADFREATFQGTAYFSQTTFQDAIFKKATFQGNADFEGATFQDAVFGMATFHKKVELAIENIKKLDLRHAEFLFRSYITTDLTKTLYNRVFIENVGFSDYERSEKNYIIYEEEHMNDEDVNLSYTQLETIYRDLKQNMQNHGDYTTAGKFYYREMEMRRKGATIKNCIWLTVYRALAGYGEKPGWVVRNSLIIILLGAVLFFFSGVARVGADVPPESSPYIIDYSINSLDFCWNMVPDFYYCFYYSVVTFTTLGYGDIHPIGYYSHAIAFSEAFIGAFFMALFVVVFARKMMR
ncbi:MAG: pentapeptide repeat-containing protein [Candidatus Methanofastidiosia archaeon]|jgi:uncharacterized protein YjbI with pentapeptide repeats